MVRLENIRSSANAIACDYFPEDTDNRGYLEVNNLGKVVSLELSDSDKRQVYVSFAKRKLVELFNSGREIPTSSSVVWH
jgi:hypothetical protein